MVATLNLKDKILLIYITSIQESTKIIVQCLQKTFIILLDAKKTNIFFKYFNFTKVFSFNSIVEPQEHTSISNDLVDPLNNK